MFGRLSEDWWRKKPDIDSVLEEINILGTKFIKEEP